MSCRPFASTRALAISPILHAREFLRNVLAGLPQLEDDQLHFLQQFAEAVSIFLLHIIEDLIRAKMLNLMTKSMMVRT